MVGHVIDADHAYARQIGLKLPAPDSPTARRSRPIRAAMLGSCASRRDGSPLAGRRWTARYAARRIAWHALDHAWEIEDRTRARP